MWLPAVLSALLALAVGAMAGFAVGHSRALTAQEHLRRDDAQAWAERDAQLRERLAAAEAMTLDDARLQQMFRSVSAESLAEQSRQLLDLASSRHQAIEQTSEQHWKAQGNVIVTRLGEYAERLARLEQQRHAESEVLAASVRDLARANEQIRAEAASLAASMKDNKVRGLWGEMQLRRVLEQAGMVAHADFVEQGVVTGGDRSARPDVVVRLPNGRCVVIDAKAPLDSYLQAANCDDAEQRVVLEQRHGSAVAGHVTALSRRKYAELVDGAVDFVVMFVPGDSFLAAAFDSRPGLLEDAARADVILASPSTLLAFLRGVAAGWRERQVAEEAEQIAALGRELHERISVFADHFGGVGSNLSRAVDSYNRAVGSFESRLMVTARRLEERGAGSRRSLTDPATIASLPTATLPTVTLSSVSLSSADQATPNDSPEDQLAGSALTTASPHSPGATAVPPEGSHG